MPVKTQGEEELGGGEKAVERDIHLVLAVAEACAAVGL